MPSKKDALWLIPKGERAFEKFEGVYVEEKQEKGNILYFLGKAGTYNTDFKCYPSAIANYDDLLKALGQDDDNWRKFLFTFTLDKKAEKYNVTYGPLRP